MLDHHYYEVDLAWDNERKGTLTATGIPSTIEVATPPEFNGGMPGIWSPEHLFTAAVNSCLMTTFFAIAENSKLNYRSFTSNAKGKLELVNGRYLMTEVLLSPVVVIEDPADSDRALRVLEKSEKACLISNSINAVIKMEPKVEVAGVPSF